MPNYQLGKIYKIVCNITGKQYVGSTCEPTLARRLVKHKSYYKDYLAGKFANLSSFEVLKNESYYIILIENWPCNNKDELLQRERYWTNNIECVNKVKNQGILLQLGSKNYKKQYRQTEKCKEATKTYNETHKAIMQEKAKRVINCPCGRTYTLANKSKHIKIEQHKQYIYNNKLKEGIIKCKTFNEFCKFMDHS